MGKKRAIPNGLRFGIASVYVSSCIAVSLENVSPASMYASPTGSLRIGSQGIGEAQAGSTAGYTTPDFGRDLHSCAVLPAQRGHPLRDLPDTTIRSDDYLVVDFFGTI